MPNPVLRIVKRIGPKDADALLADMRLEPMPTRFQWVTQLDREVRKPVQGDSPVLATADVFSSKPEEFGLRSMCDVLLERIERQEWQSATKAAWRKQVADRLGSEWLFVCRADRERGVRSARDFLKGYEAVPLESHSR